MRSRIRVYVVDESEFFRDVLQKFMSAAPDLIVAGETGSWDEAMVQVPEIRPQVVVIHATYAAPEASMPVLRFRKLYPSVRLIALVSRAAFRSDLGLWKAVADHLVDRRTMDTGLLPAIRAEALSLSEASSDDTGALRLTTVDPKIWGNPPIYSYI